jgi:signal transduction histidine kinase
MHDSLRLIRDADGNPLEVIGSLTDITDRRNMEEALKKTGEEQKLLIAKLQQAQDQLLQSEKMASIGQLAAGVAHEINNPVGFVNSNMNSLRGYVDSLFELIDGYDRLLAGTPAAASAEQLKKQADLDYLKEDVVALVKESMDGLKRVKDIVQALKDFSHVGETDWQMADLHQGLESTINIAHNEIKYKASVVKEYGQLPLVKCLASQLNQVFMNLIVNAAQAIKESGVITIRTGAEEGWVWVSIGDTGSGIAPENLSRIFEPFFTTKPVGQGTGLGLSLSYSIVHKHGGRIEVESEVGKGTTFTVHLPVEPPEST